MLTHVHTRVLQLLHVKITVRTELLQHLLEKFYVTIEVVRERSCKIGQEYWRLELDPYERLDEVGKEKGLSIPILAV